MKSFLLTLCVLSALSINAQTKNSGKVLMAIFAHPDDEGTVSPVLAKYAAEGVNVYLVVATDGRLGTAVTKIPAGDSLAAARKLETICAAEKLGIKPPIMLGLHDQLKMTDGYDAFHAQMDTLRKQITRLFDQLKPDVVLTWNASGWTGHHDHRLVGAAVTEVYESKRWSKPTQLYYAAIPTQNVPSGAAGFATVDKSFLTVTVTVSDADYAKAKAAGACHQSQFTPAMWDGMHGALRMAMQNTWHFRPHSGSTEPRQGLF